MGPLFVLVKGLLFLGNCYRKSRHRNAGRNFVSDDNAIIGLSRFLLRVDEFNKELAGCIFNVGSIEGGGVVNIIPEYAQAETCKSLSLSLIRV